MKERGVGQVRLGVAMATVPTCSDNDTIPVNNDPLAAIQRADDVSDPAAAVKVDLSLIHI